MRIESVFWFGVLRLFSLVLRKTEFQVPQAAFQEFQRSAIGLQGESRSVQLLGHGVFR